MKRNKSPREISRPDFVALRAGLALLELLLCIVVAAVFCGLLLAALDQAIQTSRQTKCVRNLNQVGMATFAYAAEHGGNLPENKANGTPYTLAIRPYLGEGSPTGPASERSVLVCPADRFGPPDMPLYYIGGKKNGYALSYAMNGNFRLNNSLYGAGFTLQSIQKPSECALCMDYEMHFIAGRGTAAEDRMDDLKLRHQEKINVVFADGHVESVGLGLGLFAQDFPAPSPFWQGR